MDINTPSESSFKNPFKLHLEFRIYCLGVVYLHLISTSENNPFVPLNYDYVQVN